MATQREVEEQASDRAPAFYVPRLTDEEIAEALKWLEEARELREAILKRRKGKPVPSSWPLIRIGREQR